MKKLIVNKKQEYVAEKIIKKDNSIKLINVINEEGNNIGNLIFPNVSDMEDFQLEEGQEWDVEIDEIEQLRIEQAKVNAEMIELMMSLLGGVFE